MLHTSWILTLLHIIYGYENIALNKPTHQSHQYNSHSYQRVTFDSSNAVDGLKSDLSAFGGQCVISANRYSYATWWVNLRSVYSIHDIRIYHRTDNVPWGSSNGFTAMFLGFYVYVSNTTSGLDGHLCFHDTNYTKPTIPAVIDIKCPVHGQYVIYYNERPQKSHAHASELSEYAHNELCEVEVNGCSNTGYYGSHCSIPCPNSNCRYCHIETGACQGCKPGYQGHQCELPCNPQFYGEVCSQMCGNCSNGETCHHINGICENGCVIGVFGEKCVSPCLRGNYGEGCSSVCHCDSCDRFSGICDRPCFQGWKNLQCNKECDGRYYGINCSSQCGDCLNFEQCHHINGSCMKGCELGYYGEKCVQQCPRGLYGRNCEGSCDINCRFSERCDRKSGYCQGGCKTGWKGLRCETKCDSNMFGVDCSKQCGHCLDGKQCHHVNGTCPSGCDPGYIGDTCSEACEAGMYGVGCKQKCSAFCSVSGICNHVTGTCKQGCKSGWMGLDCLEVKENVEDNLALYIVVAALSVCVVVIVLLIVYIIHLRGKIRQLQTINSYKESKANSLNTTEENYDSIIRTSNTDYQELGV